MSIILKKYTKASFRECPIQDRKIFNNSKCILPISVGQTVHEGEKLIATIDLINRSFRECVVLIDDTIQRYTIQIDHDTMTEQMALAIAFEEGNQWLKRNGPILANIKITHSIMRWDKWLQHTNFAKQKKIVEDAYLSDHAYRKAINKNISEFLSRYYIRKKNINIKRGEELCLAYLKEECACMCLWVDEKCQFEVYPSGRNLAMTETYNKFIKPLYPDLLRSVALRFKKYPKNSSLIENKLLTHIDG